MSSTVGKTPSRFSTLVENGEQETTARANKIIQEFREQLKRGESFTGDISALRSVIDALKHPNGIDDRKMLLEHVLVFLSEHPSSNLGKQLANDTVELLYADLPHPPETLIGNQYAWRSADGSNNNINIPDLGKGGTPYARSVQQSHPLPRNEMPDAGLVFDTLLKREKFVKHPAGLSSLMFSFAALVIHTVFRTSHKDVNINETSSYVDLAPLYGNDQNNQDKIRVRDGRGLLHPDTFAEDRLLLLPPAVCVLLVLFNRNHNYIAKMLLEINERGTWADPNSIPDDPQRSAKILAQEEEIFQIARLINCAWFASVVFSDYLSAILGLVRRGSSWSLNPFGEIRDLDHTLFERGRGNVCSVEFNCLYRWHATTSVQDEKWTEDLFKQLFPDKTWDQITIQAFVEKAKELHDVELDVSNWTFDALKRQDDGTFKDSELAGILQAATDHPASAFKARGTPAVMRLHEIMGIESNRRWGVCSLNDFRQFLGLKTYSSFLEWNPDPEIATAAEKLYGTIDRLELYPGLQAEAAKPVIDGAGLCPGYTISRAILSDAIALTRGDRFYTADYTPFNMTCWGFADCQRQPDAPGYGSTLGRLFLRTLPGQYTDNSTYTWFPLMTPEAMQPILTKLHDIQNYDLTKPNSVDPVRIVSNYSDVAQVLSSEQFSPRYSNRAARVIHGHGFFIASDSPARAGREQRAFIGALTDARGSVDKIASFFYQTTRDLMLRESYTAVGSRTKNVDIVRDVLKHVPVRWAADLAGIQLKKKPHSLGHYTPQEMFDMLSDIYSYLFLDVEAAKALKLAEKVKTHIEKLRHDLMCTFGGASRLSIAGLLETISHMFFQPAKSDRDDLLDRLHALGYPPETICNTFLAVLVGATVEMSQAMVNVVNFYLDPSKPGDVSTLASKVKLDGNDEALLQGLVNEALRLDPPSRGAYREAAKTSVVGGKPVQLGECVFVDIADASLDATVFPDPNAVNPTRTPQKRYLVGDGSARCLGADLSNKMIGAVLRAVFSFPNVRRAPGQSGVLKRFKEDSTKTSCYSYLSSTQELTPWATSMVIQFE
ncbi:Linoleate 10R-lipoxygenase [Sparassis crispa]|uniref:Linoleate 10R-lipoxygenase n=1 Tax=Sparassis crispa TaxID=139825 RepID=A0A401GWE8_9APHY|nr:Linoleate 10R-lipoxygenase [Sparassis crispa]GBE86547.1 Linoleate 10R-lipoxygenase [Sparassis crispa]